MYNILDIIINKHTHVPVFQETGSASIIFREIILSKVTAASIWPSKSVNKYVPT